MMVCYLVLPVVVAPRDRAKSVELSGDGLIDVPICPSDDVVHGVMISLCKTAEDREVEGGCTVARDDPRCDQCTRQVTQLISPLFRPTGSIRDLPVIRLAAKPI
jgi:hypothetical protein